MAELSTRYTSEESTLRQHEGELHTVQTRLSELSQLGLATAGNEEYDSLNAQDSQLRINISGMQDQMDQTLDDLSGVQKNLTKLETVEEMVQNLDGKQPIMLLPVRVETRFMEVQEPLLSVDVSAAMDLIFIDVDYINGVIGGLWEYWILTNPETILAEFELLGRHFEDLSLTVARAEEITTTERQVLKGLLLDTKANLTAAAEHLQGQEELGADIIAAYQGGLDRLEQAWSSTSDSIATLDLWQIPNHLRAPMPGEDGEDFSAQKSSYRSELEEAKIMAEQAKENGGQGGEAAQEAIDARTAADEAQAAADDANGALSTAQAEATQLRTDSDTALADLQAAQAAEATASSNLEAANANMENIEGYQQSLEEAVGPLSDTMNMSMEAYQEAVQMADETEGEDQEYWIQERDTRYETYNTDRAAYLAADAALSDFQENGEESLALAVEAAQAAYDTAQQTTGQAQALYNQRNDAATEAEGHLPALQEAADAAAENADVLELHAVELEENAGEGYPQSELDSLYLWKLFLLNTYMGVYVLRDFTTTSYELWVRIFPDDVSVHTHEPYLTAVELEAADVYWNEIWSSIATPGFTEVQLGAWRPLVLRFGHARAAWIVKTTTPTGLNWTVQQSGSPVITSLQKQDPWNYQPVSKVMPDQFVVTLYNDEPLQELPDGFYHNSTTHTAKGSGTIDANFVKVKRALGNLLPKPYLPVGINPAATDTTLFDHTSNGDIKMDPSIKWMFDFNDAVAKGMAVKIAIDYDDMYPDAGSTGGWDRLSVLGLRYSADASQSKTIVEELFTNHHYTEQGLEILEHGTPTNNTEDAKAGYSVFDRDPEAAQAVELGADPLFTPANDHIDKPNGQRLAEALGINPEVFHHIKGADQNDIKPILTMNRALYPGTLGTYLEDQAGPNFPLKAIRDTRGFFSDWVVGRGVLNPVRVGSNPYGILPTTAYSKMVYTNNTIEQGIGMFLRTLDKRWEYMRRAFVKTVMDPALAEDYPNLPTGPDPLLVHQQQFLDILGLLSHSIELRQRYASAVQTVDYKFGGDAYVPPSFAFELQQAVRTAMQSPFTGGSNAYRNSLVNSRQVLSQNSLYENGAYVRPRIFDAAFLQSDKLIYGPSVDKFIPSKDRMLATWSGKNYIDALLDSYIHELRFFNYDGCMHEAPNVLLYHMLRQSLSMSYWDASMNITHSELGYTDEEEEGLRRAYNRFPRKGDETWIDDQENPFYQLFGLPKSQGGAENISRWDFLEKPLGMPLTHLGTGETFADYIVDPANWPDYPSETKQLTSTRDAMLALKGFNTHVLNKAFHEHIDLCSYRMDAWWQGLVAKRMYKHRETATDGLYFGAYAWVENLRPGSPRAAVEGNKIPSHFTAGKTGPLEYDPDNQGFVHAPSIGHANTAAVLRAGYFANADNLDGTHDGNRMAINLSSERVRLAVSFIGGIRNGQRLSALLGYQLERGLHERYAGLAELDQYIYTLRKAFPLQGDQLSTSGGTPIQNVEARNVVDGLALLNSADPPVYPYGIATGTGTNELPLGGVVEQAIVNEVARMANALDAVADLALAESVYQVNIGNFNRAAAVINAIMEGNNPPTPEILQTPRMGRSMTHRVAVMLENTANPWLAQGVSNTARSKAEPALNNWLGGLLGNPDLIKVVVLVDALNNGSEAAYEVSVTQLGLQPIDLIYLVGEELTADASELSQRIGYYILGITGMPQDALIKIQYLDRPNTWPQEEKTLFEMVPLITNLSKMVNASRGLHQKDIVVPGSETNATNPNGIALAELQSRVNQAVADLQSLRTQLVAQVGTGLTPNAAATRTILEGIAEYGLGSSIPATAAGTSIEIQAALDSAGDVALATVDKRLAIANALINQVVNGETMTQEVERYQKAAKELFGSKFLIIPRFNLETSPVSYSSVLQTADTNSSSLLQHADDFAMDDWLHGISRVRERMRPYEQVMLMTENFEHVAPDLRPLQLPSLANEPWVGIELPSVAGVPEIEGDRLSLVLHFAPGFSFATASSGLLIDEWTEQIPDKDVDTGIAFFYDQPDSEAPNAILLAINPVDSNAWDWMDLEATLMETFSMAQKRAVEPDHIAQTYLAGALPAVVSELRMNGVGTIETDYAIVNKGDLNPNPTLFPPDELLTGEEGSVRRPGCPDITHDPGEEQDQAEA